MPIRCSEIDIALVFHAAKAARISSWGFIILMIPADAGALAQVIVELVPEWLGSYRGQKAKARAGIGRALNPEKAYRTLRDELEIADTIANGKAPGARMHRARAVR